VTHGLVIGKFYPPHRGHHGLIRQAAGEVDRLSVVVMGSTAESIPIEDRLGWMRATHAAEANVTVAAIKCDSPVDIDDPNVWKAQVAAIEAGARLCNGEPVDVVFSCEGYGDELASRIGAAHRRCERTDWLSATAVRSDPLGHWADLAPATRAGLAFRLVIVGAESTGKSRLALALAEHYRSLGGAWASTQLVDGHGSDFGAREIGGEPAAPLSPGRPGPAGSRTEWTVTDFDRVARRQAEREESAAAGGSPVLVSEGDPFSTSVWERRWLGTAARRHPGYARAPLLARRDLYLVTEPEGVGSSEGDRRDGQGGAASAMTRQFIDALSEAGHSWVLLSGTESERLALAVRAAQPLIERRLNFADPRRGPGFGPTPSSPPQP
jgi:cytidyltransferase-like protein